jgi:hypothetical protein
MSSRYSNSMLIILGLLGLGGSMLAILYSNIGSYSSAALVSRARLVS